MWKADRDRAKAQRDAEIEGRTLRLDVDGSIVSFNPSLDGSPPILDTSGEDWVWNDDGGFEEKVTFGGKVSLKREELEKLRDWCNRELEEKF